MKITYCLTATGNPLYNGEFLSHERYKTFGQHSFIIDFIAAARRYHCSVELLIEGKEYFPVLQYMLDLCRISEFSAAPHALHNADFIVLDELSREAAEKIPPDVFVFGLVHNAGKRLHEEMLDVCDKVVCMTETAVDFQSRYIDSQKLLLCQQGVDIERFSNPQLNGSEGRDKKIRVLLFTRLIQQKRATILATLHELLQRKECYNITVLGDGELFWELSNRFGHQLTVINHIPCISIQRFLPEFDVVISSARGVMEACASGIPVLCAGFGYAGVVNEECIPALMKRNLTGFGETTPVENIHRDIRHALRQPRNYWRNLSTKYFNMEDFVLRLLYEVPVNAACKC
jgi:hypothetical protein